MLDLADIQGNVLTAYGKLGFPKGCVLLFHVGEAAAGRAFVERLRPQVTTALRWPSAKQVKTGPLAVPRPPVTLNVAFTFRGLLALETPVRTLRGLPDEFIDGMAARAGVLGDIAPFGACAAWDPVWRPAEDAAAVHVLVMLNAQATDAGEPAPELAKTVAELRRILAELGGGVTLLAGHGPGGGDLQPLSAIYEPDAAGALRPTPKEHFGFVDAISDPVFHGQLPAHASRDRAVGGGKIDRDGHWTPLATGEFLLGYADEAQEIAGAAMPLSFSRNGTFFAYRKLHQNVDRFEAMIDAAAPRFGAAFGVEDPAEARLFLMAKIAGRWPDGLPVAAFPTVAAWRTAHADAAGAAITDPRALNAFTYGADADGAGCPLGAHARRMNPRDALDPLGPAKAGGSGGSQLNNRRRILRRGLPYGARDAADGEHGIVLLAVCASLFRQFEFVQQQWLNYGLDFNAGNDTCPLVGIHDANAKFVIPAAPGGAPFILDRLPQLVEMRGGDYFFTPSLTALRMIGQGLVDPT
jgi:deferrochelatase/peroxidase EfeB